jgi:hypothetical protein
MKPQRITILKKTCAAFIGAVAGYIIGMLLFSIVFLRIGYFAQLRLGGSDPQFDSFYPLIGALTIYTLNLIPAIIAGLVSRWLIIYKKVVYRGVAWAGGSLGFLLWTLTSSPGYSLMK